MKKIEVVMVVILAMVLVLISFYVELNIPRPERTNINSYTITNNNKLITYTNVSTNFWINISGPKSPSNVYMDINDDGMKDIKASIYDDYPNSTGIYQLKASYCYRKTGTYNATILVSGSFDGILKKTINVTVLEFYIHMILIPQKESFDVGENLLFDMIVENNGDRPIRFWEPEIESGPLMDTIVIMPDNTKLTQLVQYDVGFTQVITVNASTSYQRYGLNLSSPYMVMGNKAHNILDFKFDKPGTYQIEVKYNAYMMESWEYCLESITFKID